MDRDITARFFHVRRHNVRIPSFEHVLRTIGEIESMTNRESQLGQDCHVRLERLEQDGVLLCGEVTRIQKTNFPSEVTEEGVKPLDMDGYLGHGVAFVYDTVTSRLGLQFNPRVISAGRFRDYLSAKYDNAIYEFVPEVKEDAWERLAATPIRKVEVTVAAPDMLVALENENDAAADALRHLGSVYQSPVISFQLGVGRSDRLRLNEKVKSAIAMFRRKSADGSLDVRKLEAHPVSGNGDPIDLLDDILTTRATLEMPDNNPSLNWQVRNTWLKGLMR